MDDLDQDIALLLGDGLEFETLLIKPLTIREIKNIKFSNFYSIIQVLISDRTDLQNVVENVEVFPFDIFVSNLVYNEQFAMIMIEFLKTIFNKEISFMENGILIGENVVLNSSNYDKFVDIIKKQYCVVKPKKLIAKNSKQEEYLKRLAEMQKKYENHRKADSEDISDWISSVVAKHNSLDFNSVQDLTIYQLMNQFKRLNKIDEYFIGIDQLLAGASKEDVKITHWSKKITD